MFLTQGGGDVADFRGRSSGSGVAYAVCRDGGGLGATDQPVLGFHVALVVALTLAGEKPDVAADRWLPRGLRQREVSLYCG